jgi:hypothetical protein
MLNASEMIKLAYILLPLIILNCDERQRLENNKTVQFVANKHTGLSLEKLIVNPFKVGQELFSNRDISQADIFIIDSVIISERIWRITLYMEKPFKTVVAEFYENDSTIVKTIRNTCKSLLAEAYGPAKDNFAPANNENFEINNYWHNQLTNVELSYYTIDKTISSKISEHEKQFRYNIQLTFRSQ